MNNDTKRDVFNAAVEKAVGMTLVAGYTSYTDKCFKDMQKRYAAALPDDLPVIPKAVGDILQSAHGQTNLLGVLVTAKSGCKVSDTLAWIIDNQNTFARAWVLGIWRVEETGEIVKFEAEK